MQFDRTPIQLMALMQCQFNPVQLHRTVKPSIHHLLTEKVDYLMKHLECLDRHVTHFEQVIEDQFDQQEATIKEVSDHSTTVAASHNQVADHVNYLLQTVDKMQQSWDNWAEWTPVDQDKDDGQETQLPIREEPVPDTQPPMIEHHQSVVESSRTLLDVTPVYTPVQGTRDALSPVPVTLPIRVSTPEYASSRLALASLKGVTRIYVDDQTHFKVGKIIIIICELFMAQIIGLGSLVLDRPLDRDYPAGSPIREVTPADDHIVDARGRTIINGGGYGSSILITG